jgi:uncharacterized protein
MKENYMLHQESPLFSRLHEQILAIPVIDCHEHMNGPEARPPYKEPIASIIDGYSMCDLQSAAIGLGLSLRDVEKLANHEIPTDEKWSVFEQVWRASQHTAYLRVVKLTLKNVYGEESMTREALDRVSAKLADQTEAVYFETIEKAGIRLLLTDTLAKWSSPNRLAAFLKGEKVYPQNFKPLIPLPDFHPTTLVDLIPWIESLSDSVITSLDEFLEAVFEIFHKAKERGVVGIKDQSAYGRNLSYDLVPAGEAEKLFNQLLSDPRNSLGWPGSKPLNDFLFHQYMRFARDLDLPVQIHTGHMAGIYNRVDKANAVHLATVLELHREVRFDLFHGNWPYLDDYLFLGKNYPNVALDLCWLHIIDPQYAHELLSRAVFSVPHTKVHGFGGDFGDAPEFVAGHLQIAREVIAGALADLVERGWLEESEALQIAADWLFNNPNRFFRLGFEEIEA